MRPLWDLNKWSIRPGAQSARFPDSQLTVFTIRPLEKVSLMHCCILFYSQNYVLLCRLISLSLLDFFKFNLVHNYFRITAEYCPKLLCDFEHTIVSTQKVILHSSCITIISWHKYWQHHTLISKCDIMNFPWTIESLMPFDI